MQEMSDNLLPAQIWISWFYLGIGCQEGWIPEFYREMVYFDFSPFPSVSLCSLLISGGFCDTVNSEYLFLTYPREISIEILVATSEK